MIYPRMPLALALTPNPLSCVESRVFPFSSLSSHPEKLWLWFCRLPCRQKSAQPFSVLWAYKNPQHRS